MYVLRRLSDPPRAHYKSVHMLPPSLLTPILRRPPGFSIRGFLTGIALSSVLGAALYVFLTTL